MLSRANRLFHVHLNDNDRGCDWDMIPGGHHLWEFAEFFYYPRQVRYEDDWYAYDVFPLGCGNSPRRATRLRPFDTCTRSSELDSALIAETGDDSSLLCRIGIRLKPKRGLALSPLTPAQADWPRKCT